MTRYLPDTDAVVDYLKGVTSTVDLITQLGTQGHELCNHDTWESLAPNVALIQASG